MLNLKFIQDNPELVIEKLKRKNFDASEIVGQIIDLYRQKNKLQNQADDAKAEMNRISKEIGKLFREGKTEEGNTAKERTSQLKENIKKFDEQFGEIENRVNELLVQLPNLPHESVPPGKGEEDNAIERTEGETQGKKPDDAPHWDLAKKY